MCMLFDLPWEFKVNFVQAGYYTKYFAIFYPWRIIVMKIVMNV